MYYLKKRMEVAGSHCLDLDYKSKCTNVHGHNWIIYVYCKSGTLNKAGMVTDFTEIKKIVHGQLDHKHLNDIIEQPTAENIAKWIHEQIENCYKVEIQESEGNIVTFEETKYE